MEPQAIATIVLICICGGVFPAVALAAAIAYMWHYMSPDDYKQAWVPKIIFVIAMVMGLLSVLLMPIDIANVNLVKNQTFSFILGIIWQIFYAVVAIMALVVLPFATCYYEAEDTDYEGISGVIHQTKWACLYTAIIVVISVIIVLVSYWFLGYAQIPYINYVNSEPKDSIQGAIMEESVNCATCLYTSTSYELFVSIVVYIIGYLSLIGWVAFVIFGGCGMSALPISMIKSFITRPKLIRATTFKEKQAEVQKQSEKLIEIGEKLAQAQENDRYGTKTRSAFIKFRQASLKLEDDWQKYQKQFYKGGGSILFAILSLLYGIIAAAITFIWVVHIILYLGFPAHFFQFAALNYVFYYCDFATGRFPVIGAILYAFFTLHLVLAVLAGLEVVGRRFVFINAHPLVEKGTHMNSLLFNVGIFLLCCVTASQFAADAFSQYAQRTALEAIFGTAIKNLKYITYFFQYVHYAYLLAILVGIFLSLLDAICTPKTAGEQEIDRILNGLGS